MTRRHPKLRVVLGGALAGGVGLVLPASGQDGSGPPAGMRVIVDYSAGLDFDSNYRFRNESPGTYSAFVNSFDVALLSNTRNQSFEFRFGTELRFEDDPESDGDGPVDWTDPNYTLLYTRESANSNLSLSSNLRVREVDTLEPFFIDVDGDAIVDEAGFEASEGTQTTFGLRATLETGINAPLGTTYSAAYQSRTYDDTTDPDLYDRVDYRLSTSTRLRFSPVTTGTVDLSARQYEYSRGRELLGESYSASVGLIQDFSPTLSGEVSLGYSKTREEEDIDGETVIDTDQGLIGSVALSRAMPNGELYGSYSRRLLEDTFRNSLSFGRSITMAGYSLNASLGVSALDGGDPAPTFGLAYTRPLPDGQLSASINQSVTLNTDDDERTLTAAFVEYSREINNVSSFSLGLDYTLVRGVGDDDFDDETRATFVASYSRALTEDWAMTLGYRGRTRMSDTDDAVSNAVFVNIGRSFIFR